MATLGLALFAVLLYATYLAYTAPDAPPEPRAEIPPRMALPPAPVAAGVDSSAHAVDPLSLQARADVLAGQTPERRNQLLVVDSFLLIAGRYPDAEEQRRWLLPGGPVTKVLLDLRRSGQSDETIGRFIAGSLLEGSARSVPLIAAPAGTDADGAAQIGAMIARAVRTTPDDPVQLSRRYGLASSGATPENHLTRMLEELSPARSISAHRPAPDALLELEVEGMRAALREGNLVVVSGADAATNGRLILVAGFDARGDFLVRDPLRRLPERTGAVRLKAFLARPGLAGADGTPGTWFAVPLRGTSVARSERSALCWIRALEGEPLTGDCTPE